MDEELRELLPVIDTDNAKVVSMLIIVLCFTKLVPIQLLDMSCIWQLQH